MKRRTDKRHAEWHGMNWISQKKRLAIYLRDGLSCCYCGSSVEQGVKLTLDHVKPHSKGGTNHETNVVTCCHRCNSSRGNRSLKRFAKAVAAYVNHGVKAEQVVAHVTDCASRPLKPFKAQALTLIESRGSCAKALAEFRK